MAYRFLMSVANNGNGNGNGNGPVLDSPSNSNRGTPRFQATWFKNLISTGAKPSSSSVTENKEGDTPSTSNRGTPRFQATWFKNLITTGAKPSSSSVIENKEGDASSTTGTNKSIRSPTTTESTIHICSIDSKVPKVHLKIMYLHVFLVTNWLRA